MLRGGDKEEKKEDLDEFLFVGSIKRTEEIESLFFSYSLFNVSGLGGCCNCSNRSQKI